MAKARRENGRLLLVSNNLAVPRVDGDICRLELHPHRQPGIIWGQGGSDNWNWEISYRNRVCTIAQSR
jgi:hypothetical protein